MRYIASLSICFLFCFSCCTGNVTSKSNKISMVAVDSLGGDFSAKTDSILRKRQEMLAVSDTMCNFYFSEDWELKGNDPHAYWLMNQMMQMAQMISTADDALTDKALVKLLLTVLAMALFIHYHKANFFMIHE